MEASKLSGVSNQQAEELGRKSVASLANEGGDGYDVLRAPITRIANKTHIGIGKPGKGVVVIAPKSDVYVQSDIDALLHQAKLTADEEAESAPPSVPKQLPQGIGFLLVEQSGGSVGRSKNYRVNVTKTSRQIPFDQLREPVSLAECIAEGYQFVHQADNEKTFTIRIYPGEYAQIGKHILAAALAKQGEEASKLSGVSNLQAEELGRKSVASLANEGGDGYDVLRAPITRIANKTHIGTATRNV